MMDARYLVPFGRTENPTWIDLGGLVFTHDSPGGRHIESAREERAFGALKRIQSQPDWRDPLPNDGDGDDVDACSRLDANDDAVASHVESWEDGVLAAT